VSILIILIKKSMKTTNIYAYV